MANFRNQKTEELIQHLAAEFILHESNNTSLIIVTGIRMTDKLTKATILISVFPEDKEAEAIEFTKRKRSEFKEYLKQHAKMRLLPFIDFEIDVGEKNRQRVDVLSQTS